jgi:hypothetical protein
MELHTLAQVATIGSFLVAVLMLLKAFGKL